ncbi:NADPH:quinone reductase [Spongisporangium articulatum]|uniref:NADPH:quinone reductase n=1 Tax=Spongisporangium articulatum TaxID=3362603 RepID=A0ABW8AKS8_9ACTN
MQAMVYRQTGDPGVIRAEEFDDPQPGPGEVLVKVAVSGVNPTDWKARAGDGSGAPPAAGWQIPNQDGSGLIVGVGQGVDPVLLHERVWLFESAFQRPWGTAAQLTVVPAKQTVLLGPEGTYELGAALGVPFLTAHRCLTLGESMPDRLGPGALAGRTVLVQGGAGAVGNAAVQLARWADATVIATVSSPEKAQLAAAAGADHVIDYRTTDVAAEVRRIVPRGVDAIVEVSVANAATDTAVLGMHGSVALYAGSAGDSVTVPLREMMTINARWQFVLVYTMPLRAKAFAVEDVAAAVVDGAIGVGPDHGLPLHRFPLAATADAHAAVEASAVGKVLITVDDDPQA